MQAYKAEYVRMVEAASAAYDGGGDDGSGSGGTTFFLACGPMSTAYCDEVKEVVATLTESGVRAMFLDQQGLSANGCCGHPSVSDGKKMAEKGASFIKSTLGWE